MQAKDPLKTALLMLPWLFGGTVAVVLALVLLKAELTAWWPAWLHAAVVFSVGLGVAAVVQLFLVPSLRASILKGGHVGEVRLLRHANSAVSRCARTSILSCSDNPQLPLQAEHRLHSKVHLITRGASTRV
jgi:hypothetical protein